MGRPGDVNKSSCIMHHASPFVRVFEHLIASNSTGRTEDHTIIAYPITPAVSTNFPTASYSLFNVRFEDCLAYIQLALR